MKALVIVHADEHYREGDVAERCFCGIEERVRTVLEEEPETKIYYLASLDYGKDEKKYFLDGLWTQRAHMAFVPLRRLQYAMSKLKFQFLTLKHQLIEDGVTDVEVVGTVREICVAAVHQLVSGNVSISPPNQEFQKYQTCEREWMSLFGRDAENLRQTVEHKIHCTIVEELTC